MSFPRRFSDDPRPVKILVLVIALLVIGHLLNRAGENVAIGVLGLLSLFSVLTVLLSIPPTPLRSNRCVYASFTSFALLVSMGFSLRSFLPASRLGGILIGVGIATGGIGCLISWQYPEQHDGRSIASRPRMWIVTVIIGCVWAGLLLLGRLHPIAAAVGAAGALLLGIVLLFYGFFTPYRASAVYGLFVLSALFAGCAVLSYDGPSAVNAACILCTAGAWGLGILAYCYGYGSEDDRCATIGSPGGIRIS